MRTDLPESVSPDRPSRTDRQGGKVQTPKFCWGVTPLLVLVLLLLLVLVLVLVLVLAVLAVVSVLVLVLVLVLLLLLAYHCGWDSSVPCPMSHVHHQCTAPLLSSPGLATRPEHAPCAMRHAPCAMRLLLLRSDHCTLHYPPMELSGTAYYYYVLIVIVVITFPIENGMELAIVIPA